MADVFSKAKRSAIMSNIRSKNTKVERMVFSYLRKRGVYFQRHYRRVLGCPDIALPRKKLAVFIDGDFWHGRNFVRMQKRLPKKYWLPKIKANIVRDRRNRRALRRGGWQLLRVWEGDLKARPELELERIISFLHEGGSGGRSDLG